MLNKPQYFIIKPIYRINPIKLRYSRLVILLIIFLYVSQNTLAQNNQNSFSLDFGGWSLYDGEQFRLYAGLGHEWKVLPFLGIEVNASAGTFDKFNEWHEFNDEQQIIYEQKNYIDIDCKYQTLNTQINGYLNLKYDEKDNPKYYLYSGLGIGIATIQTKGTLKTFYGKKLTGEAKYSPQLYTNLEFGIGGRVGERMHMKLAVGGDNIPFEDAIAEMDNDDTNFPMKFSTYMSGAYFQITFKYFYKRNK